MYGVMDIGSNTIRLSLYDVENRADIKQILNKKKVVGLARYINNEKIMSKRGIEKAIFTLNNFKKIIERNRLEEMFIFATASLRNIKNTEEVLKKIKEETGMDVTVLSGKEEAFYGFVGATYKKNIDNGVMIDVGGGSTELVFINEGQIQESISIPIGSLNMYSKFISKLIPSKEEGKEIKKAVINELNKINLESQEYEFAYGIGGTVRGTVKLNNEIFNMINENREVSFTNIKSIIKTFYNEPKQIISNIIDVVPDRIHTILPGMIILKTIMKYYGCKSIISSEFGIREGYVIEKVINKNLEKKKEVEVENSNNISISIENDEKEVENKNILMKANKIEKLKDNLEEHN